MGKLDVNRRSELLLQHPKNGVHLLEKRGVRNQTIKRNHRVILLEIYPQSRWLVNPLLVKNGDYLF